MRRDIKDAALWRRFLSGNRIQILSVQQHISGCTVCYLDFGTRDRHIFTDKNFRLWRQHGMSVPDAARHSSKQVIFEGYPILGYNYRMTDIQAAVGREQLKRLPEIIERRRDLAQRYLKLLNEIPEVGLPAEPSWARSNWQSFCVRLPAGCDQRAVMQYMLDRGIATRRGVMCAHREKACDVMRVSGSLTQSEHVQDHGILLPLFHQLEDSEMDCVVKTLAAACVKENLA